MSSPTHAARSSSRDSGLMALKQKSRTRVNRLGALRARAAHSIHPLDRASWLLAAPTSAAFLVSVLALGRLPTDPHTGFAQAGPLMVSSSIPFVASLCAAVYAWLVGELRRAGPLLPFNVAAAGLLFSGTVLALSGQDPEQVADGSIVQIAFLTHIICILAQPLLALAGGLISVCMRGEN